MATQETLWKPSTVITLGTNADTYAMTMKNLAAVYRQSVKIDFGASFWQWEYLVKLINTFGVAPTAGTTWMELWIGWSSSGTAGTDNPGGLVGTDSAYAGYSGGTAAVSKQQLESIGSPTLDVNVGPKEMIVGVITPRERYGLIVWGNLSGQTTTNVDADHQVRLCPRSPSLQALA
jgi:hypothetical protein